MMSPPRHEQEQWIPAPPPPDEARRLEVLRQYAVLDTLPEQELDDLTALAAQICGTPIAVISLVDEHRQWFKARVGLEVVETPRDVAFCAHALHHRDLFIVPDATHDERFARNPLVTGEPGICFYAGAPLVTPEDATLGVLCVIDHEPRTLTQAQEQALRVLARQVMTHLELRRRMRELLESENRLRIVTDNAHVGLVIVNQDRRYVYANNAYAEILDLPSSAIVGRRVIDLLPEIYQEQIRPRLDRAFAGERVSYDLRKQTVEGERHYAVTYDPTKVNGAVTLVIVVITEITERRRVEELLRHSNERFEIVARATKEAIWDRDLSTNAVWWNEGYQAMFGYSPAETDPTIDSWTNFIHPEDLDRVIQSVHQVVNGSDHSWSDEYRFRCRDGTYAEIFDRGYLIRDAQGKPVRMVGTMQNITARKQAEMAVRRLAAIVEFSADAIIGKDLNSIITSWNRGAEKIFGYPASEMIGNSIMRLIPNGREQEEEQILGKIRRGEHVEHFETLRQTKDGQLIDVSVTASPIVDSTGKAIGVSKVARDITERKVAEAQIAEQAALLDKARDAILVRDLEGKILFWNKGAERVYGWTREEVVGGNVESLLYADQKRFQEANRLTLCQGEWQGELQHLTKDRPAITVEAHWTLIRDNEGHPKSVLAINTDITEKKKIEAQFMRAQRMESLGTLAGGIAHDLNNILAPIMMSIDILALTITDPQAKTILTTIETSARRGADIVRQVLSFARGLECQKIEVQPRNLLKDLEVIIKDTFPKNIRLHFSIANEPGTILGDPTQLHQVLLNLCVNARDAMPNGGSLTVGVESCVLDEQYVAMNIQARPGRYVMISVTDSGTGVPRDLLDKIFEPFFTTKALNKGTGLGLSTVMAVVKSHEGIINVYSEPGKGTTFKVYLSAVESSAEAGEGQSEQPSLVRGNGETILVVDDEASILTVTSQTLQAFGYRVLTATDGADAVATYAQHRDEIAVVLTDMMMPVMDGAAAVYALRRINPTIRVIAASGLNVNGEIDKLSGTGIQHFLLKPYTARALLKTLRTILEEPDLGERRRLL
jgi:PAS domain S-box-containing protein